MKPHYDDRDYFVPKLQAYEQRVLGEIEREQVSHVDLSDYEIGTPHHEQLMKSVEMANRFQWPRQGFEVNL